MGRPLLLPPLLLLVQTCIPGRDWIPERLSRQLGLELSEEGGRAGDSELEELEGEGSVSSTPSPLKE